VTGRAVNPDMQVLTVDVRHDEVDPRVRLDPGIEFLTCSSTDPRVVQRIAELKSQTPNARVFYILDSDHSKAHVIAELESLRPVVESGDYLVVEDGNINGNPVLPGWGEGPLEAIQSYFEQYPADYRHDNEREKKFGFTFAPCGFLIRN